MHTKLYKIIVSLVVVLVIAGVVIYKGTIKKGTSETTQLPGVEQQATVENNKHLPTVLYFGRFT